MTGTEPIGPGRFVLIVGPSGAGKDTLIDGAKKILADDSAVVFARRIVTRAGNHAEDHDSLGDAAFKAARDNGAFASWWQAHGNSYAIPASADEAIRAGRTVVANVSRAIVDDVRAKYTNVVAILITAPADMLAARLAGRNRDGDGPLDARIKRNDAYPGLAADIAIDNGGAPEQGIARLVQAIRG
ncbi:MAG: phosphonate metabolism protein/1,5-bisphosphokinase (PRPP-forming) PhnN [Pseudolabrys sp.]|jgi:ribose 1,5-bisphosphokinase